MFGKRFEESVLRVDIIVGLIDRHAGMMGRVRWVSNGGIKVQIGSHLRHCGADSKEENEGGDLHCSPRNGEVY